MSQERERYELDNELDNLVHGTIEDFLIEARADTSAGELEIPLEKALIELAAQSASHLIRAKNDPDIQGVLDAIRDRLLNSLEEMFEQQEARKRAH